MWILYALAASVLWGLNYSIAEKVLKNISPLTLLALEMLIGGFFFLVIAYFIDLKTDFSSMQKNSGLLFWVCIEVIAVTTANFLIVYSIQSKNATVAGLFELIYPLFTILFSWYLFQQYHLNLTVLIGGALIMLGVGIISFA